MMIASDSASLRKIVRRAEVFAIARIVGFCLRDVLDVRFSRVQGVYFGWIGVESDYSVPGFGKSQCQRQPHVSTADNRYFQLRTLEEFWFPVNGHGSIELLIVFGN